MDDQISTEEPVNQIRQQPRAAPAPPPTPRATSRASPNRAHGSQAPTVATPLTQSHFTKRPLLGAKGDVQRGIIVMTILGPCRAFDPPG